MINSNSDGFDFPWNIAEKLNIDFKYFYSLLRITQYYFKNNTNEISQRVRDEEFESTHNHKYTLNIKSNIDGISRNEIEKEISKEDFLFISNNYCNKILEKYRIIFKIGFDKWEINCLPNNHLMIAEIELNSKNTDFKVPFKYEKEVTYDKSYLAENLAVLK